jgi:hypothetical protein
MSTHLKGGNKLLSKIFYTGRHIIQQQIKTTSLNTYLVRIIHLVGKSLKLFLGNSAFKYYYQAFGIYLQTYDKF